MSDELHASFYTGPGLTQTQIASLLRRVQDSSFGLAIVDWRKDNPPKVDDLVKKNEVELDEIAALILRTPNELNLTATKTRLSFTIGFRPGQYGVVSFNGSAGLLRVTDVENEETKALFEAVGRPSDYFRVGDEIINLAEAVVDEIGATYFAIAGTDYSMHSPQNPETAFWPAKIEGKPSLIAYEDPWFVFYGNKIYSDEILDIVEKAPAYRTKRFRNGVLLAVSPLPSTSMTFIPELFSEERELLERLDEHSRNWRKLAEYFAKHKLLKKLREPK